MKTVLTLSLITIYFAAAAKVFPTNAQVFNFAVGDTFVYQVAYDQQLQDKNFEMLVVMARQDGGDSTIYSLQHYFNYDSAHNYLSHNTVLHIIHQDSSIVSCYNAFYSMANGCFCNDFIFNGPGYEPTSRCDSTLVWGGACINAGGGSYNVYAIEGLGVVYINSWCQGGGSSAWESQYCNLVYYHLTNGVTGGIANYYILGVPDLANSEALIQVVPNPAKTQFEVKTGQLLSEEANFALFDPTGKLLMSHKLISNSTIIQRQNISSGIYFWRVEVSGKTVRTGKVVLE